VATFPQLRYENIHEYSEQRRLSNTRFDHKILRGTASPTYSNLLYRFTSSNTIQFGTPVSTKWFKQQWVTHSIKCLAYVKTCSCRNSVAAGSKDLVSVVWRLVLQQASHTERAATVSEFTWCARNNRPLHKYMCMLAVFCIINVDNMLVKIAPELDVADP